MRVNAMGWIALMLTILIFISAEASQAQTAAFQIVAGDNPIYAQADAQISPQHSRTEPPQGIHWIRLPLMIETAFSRPQSLNVTVAGAYEVFWDGQMIGRSGHPAAMSTDEIGGNLNSTFQLRPEDLMVGSHLIALRISNHQVASSGNNYFSVLIEDRRSTDSALRLNLLVAGAIGLVGCLIALFFLWPWQGTTQLRGRFPFAALALLSVGIAWLAVWPGAFAFPYHLVFERQVCLIILALMYFGVLSFLILRMLGLERRVLSWIVFAFLPIFAIPSWPIVQMEHDARSFLLLSLVTGALALSRMHQSPNSRSIAFAAFATGVAISIDPTNLYLLLFAIMALLALQAAVTFQRANIRAIEKEARAQRLELELLKRNIQPHFLMNTLAAAQELVETSPKRASRFIEALAREFRSLLAVMGRDLIPIEDEVSLCTHYLDLMSERMEANYTLEVTGLSQDLLVPPGVLHTLIENAFSHGTPEGDLAVFKLHFEKIEGVHRLELHCPPSRTTTSSSLSLGTGMSYVRARLTEAFGEAWSLQEENCQTGWRTAISIG